MKRRSFLQAGALGFMGTLVSRYSLADAPSAAPRAKAMILLWMNGGPSHLDTWDPKPGTPTGGPTKAIKTRQSALQISESMPLIADVADRLCVIRGMSSKEGNHQRAQYLMHTSYAPNPTVVHPSLGSWVAKKLGAPNNGLPAFVSLDGPSFGAGFLGTQYGPFVSLKAGAPPDNARPQVDDARFERRATLLDGIESRFSTEVGGRMVEDRRALYASARKLMASPALSSFDLSSEPDATKKAYGDTDFGRACIAARNLVHAGVRFVEITLDGWDTHQDNFNRVKSQLGILDPAMSSLIKDLEASHSLDSTLVAWMGDFGRTPKINQNQGRDHYPQASTAVLAGGGTKPGLLGGTDAAGEKVVGTPVGVADVIATAASLMGLSPSEEMMSPVGRPIAVTDHGVSIAAAVK
jgi:hypothetical protein